MSDDPHFAHLRVQYGGESLRRGDLPDDPLDLFRAWLRDAEEAGIAEPNGMALATVDADGRPHCRIVLLKGLDAAGFLFFTRYDSAKGRQLADHPQAALTFWWSRPRARQVRVLGRVRRCPAELSDRYFASRPRASQLAAAVSPQSRVLADRDDLEREIGELDRRLGDAPVPRPQQWGGYSLQPDQIEFWQGRDFRVHDRFRYCAAPSGRWLVDRLAP